MLPRFDMTSAIIVNQISLQVEKYSMKTRMKGVIIVDMDLTTMGNLFMFSLNIAGIR
jgi:hypothetical protein